MFTFFKAQAASLIATVVDWLVTIVCKELMGVGELASVGLGNITGGITNFLLGRGWVFEAEDKKINNQAFRYLLVWGGNWCLNVGGFYIVKHFYAGIDYRILKMIVALVVGFSYNYFLQKRYVFR